MIGYRIMIGLGIMLIIAELGGFIWINSEIEATIRDADRLSQQLKDFHL